MALYSYIQIKELNSSGVQIGASYNFKVLAAGYRPVRQRPKSIRVAANGQLDVFEASASIKRWELLLRLRATSYIEEAVTFNALADLLTLFDSTNTLQVRMPDTALFVDMRFEDELVLQNLSPMLTGDRGQYIVPVRIVQV